MENGRPGLIVGMTEQNNFSLVLQQTPLSRSGFEIWKMLAQTVSKTWNPGL